MLWQQLLGKEIRQKLYKRCKNQPVVCSEEDQRVVDQSCLLQGCQYVSYCVVKF